MGVYEVREQGAGREMGGGARNGCLPAVGVRLESIDPHAKAGW